MHLHIKRNNYRGNVTITEYRDAAELNAGLCEDIHVRDNYDGSKITGNPLNQLAELDHDHSHETWPSLHQAISYYAEKVKADPSAVQQFTALVTLADKSPSWELLASELGSDIGPYTLEEIQSVFEEFDGDPWGIEHSADGLHLIALVNGETRIIARLVDDRELAESKE